MTDEIINNPQIETTANAPEVSKPITNLKPYDDVSLETYEKEALSEESSKEGVEEDTSLKQEEQTSPEEPSPEKVDDTEAAKSKKGDKEIEAIEEVKLTKFINGKDVEFKIKDAIQAYVEKEEFNRGMVRRLNQITHREQRWNQDQGQFKDKINKVIEIAQNGDFVTGIRALAKLAAGSSGLDVVKFEKQYFEQLDKVREVYSKMTPEQREAYFAKRALAEAKARADSLEEEKVVNFEKTQLQEKVSTLQQEYGLSEQEFWSNYKVIQDNLVGEDKFFKAPQEIEAEDVIKYTLASRHEEKVLLAGKKLGIDNEAILDEVSQITAPYTNLSVEDIVKVIEKSGIVKNADPKAVENLNRKAEKTKSHFTQVNSTKKENGTVDGLDKEDLEFLYRKQPKVFARPAR